MEKSGRGGVSILREYCRTVSFCKLPFSEEISILELFILVFIFLYPDFGIMIWLLLEYILLDTNK